MSENARAEHRRARASRNSKIASLETQRRSLIAALVKIDGEIDTLRGRPTPLPVMIDEGAIDDAIVDTTFGEDDDDAEVVDRDRTGDELS